MTKEIIKLKKYRQPLWKYFLNPKRIIFLSIAVIIFTAFAFENLSIKTFAATGINRTINFQGKVVNKNGTNVADGQYTFVFKLYDASSGGSNPWTETQNNVQVTAGIFRVSLGSTTSFASAGVDFNTDNLYLAINFNSDGEMTPRVRFAAVPYAINAETVGGLTVTNTTGTLTIPNAKTVQFGGAFTTSAQDLTLTLSGATNVTLPTTGTLATLAGSENLSNKSFTSTVTFSGITTDITTGSNENLTISPNGTGNVLLQTQAGGQAALIVDKTGLGDIFAASASGVSRFAIKTDGTASSSAGFTVDGVGNIQSTNNNTLTVGGGTTGKLIIGKSGQVVTLPGFDCSGSGSGGKLTTTSGGVLTCAADGGGSTSYSPFQESTVLGINYQVNTTEDFLIGGVGTTSAKFAILGVAGSTVPTASVSAQNVLGQAIVLSGDGTIQTTRNNTLTLGGNTSGTLVLKSSNIIVFQNPGGGNTMVGESAGAISSAASSGTYVGFEAGLNNSASDNTFVGAGAGRTNGSGISNTFLGKNAGYANNGGQSNVIVGFESGRYTNASYNAFLGQRAGYSNNSGANNVFLGFEAGESPNGANANTSGQNNIFIGYQSGPGSTTQLTNSGAIGYQAIVNASNSLVLGGTGANALKVGIGTQIPLSVLDVEGGIFGGNAALIVNQTGNSVNDIFAASASGTTKFVIKNDGTASSSAGFTIDGVGNIQSTRFNNLTIGGATTGNILLRPKNGSGFIGIGTTNPTTELYLHGVQTFEDVAGSGNTGSIKYTTGGSGGTGGFTFVAGATNNISYEFRDGSNSLLQIHDSNQESVFSYDLAVNGNFNTGGALTEFWNAAPVITTGTNTNLTITPNGSGNLVISTDGNTGLYLGSSTNTPAVLSVSGGMGLNAAAIINQTISGNDILAASASGVSKFVIKNDGTASSSAGFTIDGVGNIQSTNNNTLTVGGGSTGKLIIGKASQTVTLPGFDCSGSGNGGKLTTTSGGVLTCAADGGGTSSYSPFQESTLLGLNYQVNTTEDFLIGGVATTSAKFAILGVAGARGTQTASISGSIVLDAAGTIQTTNNQFLTLGGATTGDIYLRPGNSSGLVRLIHGNSGGGGLMLGDSETDGLNKTARIKSYAFSNGTSLPVTMMVANNQNNYNGLSIGGGSGSEYAVTEIHLKTGATASTTIGTTRLYISSGGLIGIGNDNSSPQGTLDVKSALGTAPTATVSGSTSTAALVIDNTLGDLLTASSSGLKRFTIQNDGNILIGTSSAATEKLTLNGGSIQVKANGDPSVKGTVGTSASAYGIDVSGQYAYVVEQLSGLQIFNINNPTSPTLVSTIDTPGSALSVDVSGQYAYVADDSSGLEIIDISVPTAPRIVGNIDTFLATDVFVSGRYAYVSDYTAGLLIIDISNPANPVLVGSYDTPDFAQGIYVVGKFAYVADYSTGLMIFDVSNPSKPSWVGTYNTSGGAFDVSISGKFAYVADDAAGLQIVDISNPASPTLVGNYNSTGSATDLYVNGKYVYVVDDSKGIVIVDVTVPGSLVVVGNYSTTATSRGVKVVGKYLYAAEDSAGLKVLDVNGIDVPALYAGNIGTNVLMVNDNAEIANSLIVGNSLSIGSGGLFSSGSFAFLTASGSGNLIQGAPTGQALLILNQTGNQDILAASSSGVSKFVIKNDGTASSSAGFTIDGVGNIQSTNNNTLTVGGGFTGKLIIGKAAQTVTLPGFDCSGSGNGGKLTTTSGGVLACAADGGTTSYSPFQDSSAFGINYQVNTTEDFLVGGVATSSAKFAVLGIAGTTVPTASVSAQNVLGQALYIKGDGSIQATRNNNLTIGGDTTGTIVLSPGNSIAGSVVVPGADNLVSLGASSSARFKDVFLGPSSLHVQCTVANGCGQVMDYAVGINTATNSLYIGANGRTGTLNQLLTLTEGGLFGVGTTTPNAQLYVTRASTLRAIGRALAIFDQNENQDIFAASASGVTKFVIKNDGTASSSAGFTIFGLGSIQTTSNQTLTLGGATTGNINLTPNNGNGSVNITSTGGLRLTGASAPLTFSNLETIDNASDGTITFGRNTAGTVTLTAKDDDATSALTILAGGASDLTLGGNSGDIHIRPGATLYLKTAGNQNIYTFNMTGTSSNDFGNATSGTLHLVQSTSFPVTQTGAYIGYVLDLSTNLTVPNSASGNQTGILLTLSDGGASAVATGISLAGTADYALVTAANAGFIGIGTTTPIAALHVSQGQKGGNAAAIIDQIGATTNDILAASSSGVSKFVIKNDGTASSSAGFSLDGVGNIQSTRLQTLTVGGGATGNLIIGRASQAVTLPGFDCSGSGSGGKLTTTSGGVLTCSADGGGGGAFIESTTFGTIIQGNTTEDLLMGGVSTASAKFAVLGIAGTTVPTASVSAQNGTNLALVMAGDGSVQTVRNNTLTIGGNTTGAIQFKPGNASNSLTLASNGAIGFNGSFGSSGQCLITSGNSTAPIWGGCVSGSGGTWFTLQSAQGTLFPINTTLDMLWGGIATSSARFHLYGDADANKTPVASISANTSAAGLVIDNKGTGALLTASSGGATRFTVFQNGNVMIGNSVDNGYKLEVQGSVKIGNNTTTDDIVKQTTSDFTQGGSTISTNDGVNTVTTSGNQLKLVTDLIGAGATLTAPAAGQTTGTNITTGSVIFQRADKKFVIYVGGASTSKIYDPIVDAWATGPVTSAAVNLGAGAQAFQRADGNFMIIHGGAATTTTVYSPGAMPNIGSVVVGPTLPFAVGAGSIVIRRTDGKVLLIHGNAGQSTSIYDPNLNTFQGGPSTGQNITTGSFAFQRPDGKWIIGIGGSTTTVVYDPASTSGGVGGGTFSAGPALTTGTPGAGTHAIQLPDGRFMVLVGGSGNTQIYSPANGTFAAGSTLATDTMAAGGHSFQRSDGKWVVVVGGASKNLQLFDPTSGANGSFSQLTGANGLQGATGAGVGSATFQRPDGKYYVVHGNGAQLTTIYDAGWNTTGTWTSEDINNTKISTYSAMMWSANPQSANNNARIDSETLNFAVKTGENTSVLASNQYRNLQDSGDIIRAVGNAQYAKIQVTFTSPVRSNPTAVTGYINQSNIYQGEGGTFLRRSFIQPAVFSIRVQNPLVMYGDPTGGADPAFGRNFATGSATMEGVVTDNSNRLSLATLRNFPTATASAGFNIASASANLGATVGAGAHTIERNNGQFLTITGNGSTTTKIYDIDTNTWSAGPTLPSAAGAGAHSFLLPDGRFFTVLGNGTATAIFDPQANLFYAGPTLIGNVGAGSNTFMRSDGFFVILNGGNVTDTNILDPFTMAVTKGPYSSIPINSGALNIRRADGRIVVFGGAIAAQSATIYDPGLNAFVMGPAMTTTTGAGDSAVQMSTGRWLITRTTTATNFYDPITNISSAGPTNGVSVVTGSFMIPRSDGKVLISRGSGFATTAVFDPQLATGTMPAGPTLPCTLGAGAHVFQRQTGEYVVICGGAGGNTAIIDAGWNLGGTYTSEQIGNANLSATSSIFWKNSGEGNITLKYRTASSQQALGVSAWKDAPTSGSPLSITAGDSWLQVKFDLQGTLQDLPGAKTRAWLASDSGGAVVYYRAIQAPILQYWKLINVQDPTLLTLSSGGSSVFRFSADGQAYTSDNGAWNSGGADLAERYSSKDSLQAGEVVSLDRFNPQNTKRSTNAYDQNAMGVVSTQPGFVAGAFTENSYPIALVGRVPVKVSNENGDIKAGDYLTSASIPGYAMKATVGGRVLGQAMEDFDVIEGSNQISECPKFGAGSLPTTKCGTVTVFVNLTSYNGQSVDVAMKDSGYALKEEELPVISGIDFSEGTSARRQQEILGFLKTQKDNGQGIYTDRVAASQEIISPTIVTDLLIAKKIKAESIEGLEIITNSIETLSNRISTGSAITNFSDKLSLLAQNQVDFQNQMASIAAKLEKMDNLNLLTMSNISSGEGQLTTVANLAVFNTATFAQASVLDNLQVGNNMTLSMNAINTIGADLEIQSLKQGAISFLGGLIRFDTDGKVTFSEDVAFQKNVAVTGVLSAHTVASTELQLAQGTTTVLTDTEVDSTAAAGLVTLKRGTDHMKINNPLVKESSFIFITPKTKTSQNLFLIDQKEPTEDETGSFTVGLDAKATDDIKFNYLIVN